VFDGESLAVVDAFDTGIIAQAMAVNPATNRIYIAGYEPGDNLPSVAVVDGAVSAIVNRISTSIGPIDVAVSVARNLVLLAGVENPENTRLFAVIDGQSESVVEAVAIDSDAIALLVDDELDRVYVSGYRQPDNARTLLILEAGGPVFPFSGFAAPVDGPPVVNALKAGAAVPVKFSLGGDRGLAIFADGYPRSHAVECGSAQVIDPVEETVTAGGSSLHYDPSTDRYVYVWKSSKDWAGACRELQVKFVDGETYTALFSLRP
jgi:hypothetical protein